MPDLLVRDVAENTHLQRWPKLEMGTPGIVFSKSQIRSGAAFAKYNAQINVRSF
jgi:hypothetical protein